MMDGKKKKVSLNQRWLNGRTDICASRRVNRDTVGLIDSPYSFTHTCRIDTDRGFMLRTPMSAGPTMRLVTVEESLSLSLSSSFPSISSPDREETFLENSSGGQWASFLAWRGNEGGGVERTPTSWRFDGIILYTREKKERNERKRGKKPKIRSKNWIIKPCVRERGTLHYHKYLRLDGRRSSQYKFESRVEGEKEKYLFIASRIFMFSKLLEEEWGLIDGSAI